MKAITLWQPWASFIADGFKTYETRSWPIPFGGNIAIHASKKWTRKQIDLLNQLVLDFSELGDYAVTKLPLGVIVAACKVIACIRVEDIRDQLSPLERALGNYEDGRFAWQLEVVRIPDHPIPANGRQGIWEWNPDRGDRS